jgi:hypothetical protein
MSFVFVSHCNEDKPRLRAVMDRLIASGFKLWLDTPTRLNYSAEEIITKFFRIDPGRPWEQEINEALDAAYCVLFLASARFLEPARQKWHSEVGFAVIKGTLVTAKIDEVDLRSARVRGLSDLQYEVLQWERDAAGHEAWTENSLALLINAIEKKVAERANSNRTRRFGTFTDFQSSGRTFPTEEQLDCFFMMLDREREVDQVSASRSPISIVIAAPDERPPWLRRRLHEVELPYRFCTTSGVGGNLRFIDTIERRARILSGEPGSQLNRWSPVGVSWPIDDRPEADPCGVFLRTLISKSPLLLQDLDASGSHADVAGAYLERLRLTGLHVLVYSSLDEGLGRRHLTLIKQLHDIFVNAPKDRFLILVNAAPKSAWRLPFWGPGRAFSSAAGLRPIALGSIGEHDLDDWVSLMLQLVQMSRAEIEQALGDAYEAAPRPTSSRLSLSELQRRLRSQAERWPLRCSKSAVLDKRSRATGWGDEPDTAFRS